MKVRGNLFIGTHLPHVTGIVERYYGELVSHREPLAMGQETTHENPSFVEDGRMTILDTGENAILHPRLVEPTTRNM